MVKRDRLTVTVSKTSDGKSDYLQVMSEDMVSLNVVLVADRIEVRDARAADECES